MGTLLVWAFVSLILRDRTQVGEGQREREREEESQAASMLLVQSPRPEPKSRVGHLRDWATQAPRMNIFKALDTYWEFALQESCTSYRPTSDVHFHFWIQLILF